MSKESVRTGVRYGFRPKEREVRLREREGNANSIARKSNREHDTYYAALRYAFHDA
jgi:hypothetical protein